MSRDEAFTESVRKFVHAVQQYKELNLSNEDWKFYKE